MYINDTTEPQGYFVRSAHGYQELNSYIRGGLWGRALHSHTHLQYLVVVSGSLSLKVEGQTLLLTEGCASLIPPGVRHELYSATSQGYEQVGANIYMQDDDNFGGLIGLLKTYVTSSIIMENVSLAQHAKEYQALLKNGNPFSVAKAAAMINDSLLEVLERIIYRQESSERFDDALSSYLGAHLADNLKVGEVAEHFHMSVSQLERLTRKYYDVGVSALYNQKRLAQACILMKDSWQGVAEVARQVGFQDAANFSNFFRKQTGQSPTQYRKMTAYRQRSATNQEMVFTDADAKEGRR